MEKANLARQAMYLLGVFRDNLDQSVHSTLTKIFKDLDLDIKMPGPKLREKLLELISIDDQEEAMARKKMIDEISIGDSIKYRGQIFEYLGTTKETIGFYTGDMMNFKSKTSTLRYPPIRFYNDVYGHIIEIIPKDKKP